MPRCERAGRLASLIASLLGVALAIGRAASAEPVMEKLGRGVVAVNQGLIWLVVVAAR